MANSKGSKQTSDTNAIGTAHDVRTARTVRRTPMPIELRAKQFMPFAAVTGLEPALRQKEREREMPEE